MEEKKLPPEVREGLKDRARKMRSSATEAEEVLWQAIRGRRLDNLKIRRQRPIGPYIVDFFCIESKLIIEIDGPIHESQKEYDRHRENDLTGQGYRILRFTNEDILHNLEKVLKIIRETAMGNG